MSDVEAIFEAMRVFVPGVTGNVRPPRQEDIAPGKDNCPVLAEVFSRLVATYPTAGRAFAAVRTWSMVSWQPTVLAVVSVHVVRAVPSLDKLAVSASHGSYGYSLPVENVQAGRDDVLIAAAVGLLRRWIDAVFADFAQVAQDNKRLAERVVADRILATLARLTVEGILPPQAEAASTAWLDALAPVGLGAGLTVQRDQRSIIPRYDRRVCSLEFRTGALLCPNCPKLAPDKRAARTRSHWEAHVRAL